MASSGAFTMNLDTPRHKLVTGCMLTALPCCCSCADKRPQAPAYPIYVDGRGIRMEGKRWQRYCRKCRDYWQSLASDSSLSLPTIHTPESLSTPSVTSEMPSTRRIRNEYASLPALSADDTQLSTLPSPPNDLTAIQHSNIQQNQDTTPQQPPTNTDQPEQAYPLGTREDVQQDDYESPLAGMFGRAYGRYREAEAARQASQVTRTQSLLAIAQDGTYHDISLSLPLPTRNPLFDPTIHTVGRQMMEEQARVQQEINRLYEPRYGGRGTRSLYHEAETQSRAYSSTNNTREPSNLDAVGFVPGNPPLLPSMHSNPTRMRHGFHRQFYTNPFETSMRMPQNETIDDDDNVLPNPIDSQQSRPSPIESEDLKADFGCKVCTEQRINTVCMPCMHACMCRWCASIHKDDCRDETGRWNGSLWKCPICRKQISEVKRFYL